MKLPMSLCIFFSYKVHILVTYYVISNLRVIVYFYIFRILGKVVFSTLESYRTLIMIIELTKDLLEFTFNPTLGFGYIPMRNKKVMYLLPWNFILPLKNQ